jgi:hypothetical protein
MLNRAILWVVLLICAVTQGFAASVSCSPTSIGFGENVLCTLTYGAANYPSGTGIGFSVNGQSWGVIPAQPGGGTFTTGVPINIRNTPGTYQVLEQESFAGTKINLASTTLTVRGVAGFVNPKYVIVGVTYAPPGPSSSVTYANSTLVGNTTKISNSFKSGVKTSILISGTISAWTIVGGARSKITGTDSTEYTQTSSNTSTVTISKQNTVSDKTSGTGGAFFPVNHDYDTIWLWLNPLVLLTTDPGDTSKVQ